VDLAATGKILFDNCEIQGITNALYDVSIIQGGLVEVFNSKIRAAQYGILRIRRALAHFLERYTGGRRRRHQRLRDLPCRSLQLRRGYNGVGSHLHGESSQANKSYDVNAVRPNPRNRHDLRSTVHVKMNHDLDWQSNRPMSSAFGLRRNRNFIGTEFLYENTGGALSQGRLADSGSGTEPT